MLPSPRYLLRAGVALGDPKKQAALLKEAQDEHSKDQESSITMSCALCCLSIMRCAVPWNLPPRALSGSYACGRVTSATV